MADEAMRASRTPIKLRDLDGVELPDYGDPMKVSQIRGMSDQQLIDSINNPDGLGGSVVLDGRTVVNGNHRIGEALRRMNDPFLVELRPTPNYWFWGDALILAERAVVSKEWV